MSTYPFMQVDAFTTRRLAGNSCAIVFDADPLDSETMQAIARENNLSETSFVLQSDKADIRARYFTPAEEIPLAGHPTVATVFALFETGRLAFAGDETRIMLELEVGPIPIDVYSRNGVVERVVMSQKKPEFLGEYDPAHVMPAFGLTPDDYLGGSPIQTVSTGTPMMMVPIRDHDALRRSQLIVDAYRSLKKDGDFFSAHLFCLTGATDRGHTFARHFGVPPDTIEDPFTGSATGSMASYMWRHGLLKEPTFIAEQGHWMERPGEARVEIVGPPDDITTVRVGGAAVTVIRGELEV